MHSLFIYLLQVTKWSALEHPTKNSPFCIILHGICIIYTYTLFSPAVHEGCLLPSPREPQEPGVVPSLLCDSRATANIQQHPQGWRGTLGLAGTQSLGSREILLGAMELVSALKALTFSILTAY